jgi:hypothetical protein
MIAYVDENGMITSTPPDPEQRTSVEAEEILLSPPKQTEEDQSVSVRKGLLYMYHESRGLALSGIWKHAKAILPMPPILLLLPQRATR